MPELTKEQQAELQKELKDCKDQSPAARAKHVQSFMERTLGTHISKDAANRLGTRVLKEASEFRQQFKQHTSTAIITAFGLLIALSWQELIKGIVTTYTKTNILTSYPYIAQLLSALIITIVAVAAIMIVSRWAQKPQ